MCVCVCVCVLCVHLRGSVYRRLRVFAPLVVHVRTCACASAAIIQRCKKAELLILLNTMKHCRPDCGIKKLPKCEVQQHSHGKSCRTEKCQQRLDRCG